MDYAIVECKGLLLDCLYVWEKINPPKKLYMHGILHCINTRQVLHLEVSPLRVLVKAEHGRSDMLRYSCINPRELAFRLALPPLAQHINYITFLFRPPHGKFKTVFPITHHDYLGLLGDGLHVHKSRVATLMKLCFVL